MGSKTKVFSVILQKGGVTKSTTTYNLGSILAKRGYKVLVIDLDPSQSSLSILAGITDCDEKPGVADVMLSYTSNIKNKVDIKDVIYGAADGLDVCPVSVKLNGIDLQLSNVISRETCLKRALASTVAKNYYDFIFIDNQPSLSLLPVNSLCASDYVIIPCACSYLSYKGLNLLLDTLDAVRENLNPKLKIYGVVATLKQHTNHSQEIEDKLSKEYNLLGSIPTSVKAMDNIYTSQDVAEFAPNSKVALAYEELADKVIYDYENGVI